MSGETGDTREYQLTPRGKWLLGIVAELENATDYERRIVVELIQAMRDESRRANP